PNTSTLGEKIYIGQTVIDGPFTVVLEDLGATNGTSSAPASFNIYYNNKLFDAAQMLPNTSKIFKANNATLYLTLFSTYTSLYSNQSWARIGMNVNYSAPITNTSKIDNNLIIKTVKATQTTQQSQASTTSNNVSANASTTAATTKTNRNSSTLPLSIVPNNPPALSGLS
ncbi:MAG: hypothetical protein ACP5RI_04185, partial [Candidatus Micrarchaeia archaeon]